MKNFAFRFLGVAMLGTACAFLFTDESTVGKPVDDSVALSIRGGGCDNKFETDSANPVYCGTVASCQTQKQNKHYEGDSSYTSGKKQYNCGNSSACGFFVGPADCANPTTAVATGIVIAD